MLYDLVGRGARLQPEPWNVDREGERERPSRGRVSKSLS